MVLQSAKEQTEVSPEELRWSCPPECLPFESTDLVTPAEGTIGQDRALKALKIGLELYSPGYNIYVSGLTGTGRSTTVKELLAALSPRCEIPRDRVYVRNFGDHDRPRLLTFSAGKANVFRRDVEEFVKYLQGKMPRLFEDKEVTQRREEVVNKHGEKEQKALQEFQDRLNEDGLALVTVQAGPVSRPDIFPLHEDQPMQPQEFEQLVEKGEVLAERFEQLKEKAQAYQEELQDHMRRGRNSAREMGKELEKLNREVGLAAIEWHIEDLRDKFGADEAVGIFLDEVTQDVLEHLPMLSGAEEVEGGHAMLEAHYQRYVVNVIADHSQTKGCPVISATNPTHTSLFGTIEREMEIPGIWKTDHTMVKGGALLDADGGYLLLNALDVLQQPGVWPMLMRALKCASLEIGLPEMPFLGMTTGLKPEPIDFNVKVILIGEPHIYHVLYANDPDFRKIFKVKADFTPDMDLMDENLQHYSKVVARICEKEDLRPLSREAIGRLAESSVRTAGRKDKISTRFAEVADVIREANYWCGEETGTLITRDHVEKALRERNYRSSGMDSRIQELMEKDFLIIKTDGEEVGQVNGLSVYDLGYHAFGKPTLITATTAVGQSGIISIEREARLSGGIYDKGVLIISGYLRRMFARNRPLALTASLCFEQSYSGVDGDSASITEIFALLSDLSGIPIDQGIAVTGSINQRGVIQPIGGANEKIEGFFRLCQARGLTGSQGVIMPRRNVSDLMLARDVIDAVEAGEFHIYAVSSIEEGIEILTGVPGGERDEEEKYPEGSIFRAVDDQLAEYLEALRGSDKEDWKPIPETAAKGREAAGPPDPGDPPHRPPPDPGIGGGPEE